MAFKRDLVTRSGIEIVSSLETHPMSLMRYNMKTTTDILGRGDLLELVSTSDRTVRIFGGGSTSTAPTSSTQNTIFCGVCWQDVPGDEQGVVTVQVATKLLIRAKCSTAAKPGQSLSLAASAGGPTRDQKNAGIKVDWVFIPNTAEGFCWAMEDIAAGAYGLILVDVWQLAASLQLTTTPIDTVTT
jgi:hypothetical protein